MPIRERSASDAPRLLTVARLVEKKGVDDALRAVAAVRFRHPGLRYDVVGDGPLRGGLEALAGELGLGDAVIFHGARYADAVREMMDAANVFVLASRTAGDGDEEGTPNVLLEAQACGLPILSTTHSGIPEVVDPQAGVLVAEGDPAALARAL